MNLSFWSPTLWRTLLCVAALGLSTSACVEDIGLVDRTGADKLTKTGFEGVWLYMTTTVDVPYSSAISFVGEQPFLGGTRKVVFDVQEKWLVAYPTVETIEGTEAEWKTHSIRKYWDRNARNEFVEFYVGPPVARWPIESHFDVKRSYNSYNGAQSNELTENTVDRPWYQRDYMRISWHRQGIQDFFYSLRGGGDAYYVGDERPGDPDQMTVDADGGYFDFVVHTMANSTGQYACSIFGLTPYDCAQAEVKVRHSFRRLDHRRDYEPLRYHNDEHMDKFGFFLTERPTYDYDWGPTTKGQVSWANRWNLWLDTYDFQRPVDAEGNSQDVTCMFDKECDRDGGERCQKEEGWFDEGYCAVPVAKPFRERGLRPVIYHLSQDWHDDYIAEAYITADGWSDVFKDAVAWLYFYEGKGLASPKACTTHADCGNADLRADVTVPVLYNGIPCHVDADCGSASCDAANFCAVTRTCNAASPCATGQACNGGVCEEDGQTVLRRLTTQTLRGSTVVYAGDSTILTHDTFPNALRSSLPNGYAWVRFIHAASGSGTLSANVNGEAFPGGDFNADRDYDPQDPGTQTFMAAVPAGSGVSISVLDGGNAVATTQADIVANAQYLVVYDGTNIGVAGSTFNDSNEGIRLFNMADGTSLDLGIEGIKRAESVGYRSFSEYFDTAGAQQRATVTNAGSRGDITCNVDDTIGSCVGWPQPFTDADEDAVRQIKAGLPDMFVLCENTFDSIAAAETFADNTARLAHFGDARYTRDNGYNPCGDPALVPAPESLKKIGDARYSYFYWVNEPQRSGPLGYGPSLADPDTGQMLTATANIYGGSIHTYSRYAMDLLRLVTGDLDVEDVITGKYILEAIAAKQNEDDANTAAIIGALNTADHDGHSHGVKRLATMGDVSALAEFTHEELAVMDPGFLRAHQAGLRAPSKLLTDADFPELLELMSDPERYAQAMADSIPKVDVGAMHERLGKIRGTWIEDLAITNEIKTAARYIDPTGEMTQEQLRGALSPATWSTKHALRTEAERTKLLAKNNMFMAEFVDDALWGLAQDLKAEGLEGEELRIRIGQLILRGVLEHEVGHTVGLRHNFSGSTDVFNFFDGYYDVREKEMILCQTDNWCDDVGGRVCAMSECNSDGDCVAGTLCDNGACSAPAADGRPVLVPTGTCSDQIDNSPVCSVAQVCPGDATCHEGRCFTPREQMVPRPWMTDNERANRRTEYQYSTIMDYGGRINSDLLGLGKYDYAAIRFGYTQLVDVYGDISNIDQRIENTARLTGSSLAQYSFYKNTRNWPTRGTGTFHAFNYLTNYVGVEENLKRHPVPYLQVKGQRSMAVNDQREFLDLAYVEVPFAFCSDEYRGNMGCYYFDQGIDPGEMAAGATDQLKEYYIFDAFKRERLFYGMYGNPMGYYARIMDRYMRVLGDVGMYYALYDNFFFRYAWYQSWKESPLGGLTLERSAKAAFATLKDVMASPAPGSHVFDPGKNAYVSVSFDADVPGTDLNVPFGIGRFPFTQFGTDLGYNYWEHPVYFGSFWEKLGALVTLTDSTAYFIDTAVGEQLNIGVGTSLGYNTVFSEELNDFLGGMVAEELDFYAGRVIQGRYVPPSISADDFAQVPVEPGINNFTLKFYAALYGLAFLPAGFDPQFVDRMAVFYEGEANYYNDGSSAALTEYRFEDPVGGKVYVAYSTNYGDFGEPKIDVAATLVLKGQDLADDWETASDPLVAAELERRMGEVREILDVLRGLNQVYGTSTLGY